MEIKVKIIDKYTLELLEDAKAGDIINLNNISIIDNDIINAKIDNSFNERLVKEIENTKNKTMLEVQTQISKYNERIALLSKEKDDIKVITLNEEKSKYNIERSNLENSFKLKENELTNKINNLLDDLKDIETKTKDKMLNELNSKITLLKESNLKQIELIEKDKNNLLLKESELNHKIELLKQEKLQFDQIAKVNLDKEVNQLVLKHKEELLEKDKEISNLTNQRAIKNVKQTGEDLESWCDSEVKNYMQNGLFNCLWSKDNTVLRSEDESKGSKADFLFSIFSDDNHSTLLTNVCLEMKDENPDSTNRRKNEDHFKALDKNRTKKGCKYALLVSNLELDKPNDLPMYRVLEYPDMYVVRPGYLMTFLNMIVSLSTKFKDLILNIEKEKIEFKATTDIIEDFEDLKRKYLEKPLELLEKEITGITSCTSSMKNSLEKIEKHCEQIRNKYIDDINNKISKFNIVKLNKKIDKVE